MKHLGAHNTFTQLAVYHLVQEMLSQLKVTSDNTPGQLFRCTPQAHARVCRHILTVRKGPGHALHVMKKRTQKAILNNYFYLECHINLVRCEFKRSVLAPNMRSFR